MFLKREGVFESTLYLDYMQLIIFHAFHAKSDFDLENLPKNFENFNLKRPWLEKIVKSWRLKA